MQGGAEIISPSEHSLVMYRAQKRRVCAQNHLLHFHDAQCERIKKNGEGDILFWCVRPGFLRFCASCVDDIETVGLRSASL